METRSSSFFESPPDRILAQWTEQLYREYEHVLFSYRAKLRRPVIRIADLETKWGLWDPNLSTITINHRLIQKYPWDVVVEVLKHEIAHQWVHENYSTAVRPHGAEFAAACEKFGVPDWAASASGELPTHYQKWRDRAMSAEEERLLKRVEKLLALAGSSNEHESLLAMRKVQQMYAKYEIERVRLDRAPNLVYFLINPKKKRMSTAQSMIGSILAEHFFVKVVYGKLYDAPTLTSYAVMELMGTRENVLMAEYVYGFLQQQTESLWRRYSTETGRGLSSRRSYMMGVLTGFSAKLRKPDPEVVGSGLIKISDPQLERYVHERYPRLVNRYWGGGSREKASFDEGQKHGHKLNLHRPITRSDGNLGKLIK